MVASIFSLLAIPAALIPLVAAKTDLSGCTSTDVSSPAGASYAWYVPGTGELCEPLDCGGGRAPPKYSVPGCPQYTGTATYSPSYLAGYSATEAVAASTAVASATATASASSDDTEDYDDGDDSSDDYGDDSSDDDENDDGLNDSTEEEDDEYYSTAVWRTADNPTATIHPYLLTSIPSGVSTFWIPEEIETGSTTWEAVVPTTYTDGSEGFLPATTPASSDLPAICAIATNSGCGMTTSTIKIPGKTVTGSASSATGSETASSSLSMKFVKSVPTRLRSADDGSAANSTSSTSDSASATPSQGAAAGLERTLGAVGLLAAALGALVAL